MANSFGGNSYISIHALLAESDNRTFKTRKAGCNISIHALLAESDLLCHMEPGFNDISIHALLAESDNCCPQALMLRFISIHALLAESDRVVEPGLENKLFLSTLSLRRATAKVHKTVGALLRI